MNQKNSKFAPNKFINKILMKKTKIKLKRAPGRIF